MDDPVYKYYKNPQNRTRSTKNFTSAADAYAFKASSGGIGDVIEVQGKARACNYCAGRTMCNQAGMLQQNGLL
jgi:hypothetical protein